MKLYHINPNDYGAEYFIVTDSEGTALMHLRNYLLKMANDPANDVASTYMDEYNNLWATATVDRLPKKYSIDEYEDNVVVETEIS